jgi:peptidoglycan/xylan/chitin deacetylase (PgdA/CDA1 family)
MRTRIAIPVALFAAISLLAVVQFADAHHRAVRRLPTTEKVVALTFDDGPDPRFTRAVIEVLNEEGVPGTFFVVGSKVEADGGRTDYTGHIVGFHCYSHRHGLFTAPAQQIAEFERCARSVPAICDTGSGFYRAPYGVAWPPTVRWADQRGTYLSWSVCYDKLLRSKRRCFDDGATVLSHEERVAALVGAVSPGDIVLMHDGNGNGAYLVEDLRAIIRALKAEGYRFVTPRDFPEMQ